MLDARSFHCEPSRLHPKLLFHPNLSISYTIVYSCIYEIFPVASSHLGFLSNTMLSKVFWLHQAQKSSISYRLHDIGLLKIPNCCLSIYSSSSSSSSGKLPLSRQTSIPPTTIHLCRMLVPSTLNFYGSYQIVFITLTFPSHIRSYIVAYDVFPVASSNLGFFSYTTRLLSDYAKHSIVFYFLSSPCWDYDRKLILWFIRCYSPLIIAIDRLGWCPLLVQTDLRRDFDLLFNKILL